MTTKRRLLWIGDAVVSTGFERGTRYITQALMEKYEVHVLGINHLGDPHDYPCKVWPAAAGGDWGGLGRIKELLQKLGPSVVVVQNDPWNFPEYLKYIGNVPTIGYVAVDGLNCQGDKLNGLAAAVFWTKFGEQQAKNGGYVGDSRVIPLGVDLGIYQAMERGMARERIGLRGVLEDRGLPKDVFIVGVVGRNQQRKRLDLTLKYFAEWVHWKNIGDAVLWVHEAPTNEQAYDVNQLAKYYCIGDRVILPEMEAKYGFPEVVMARIYSAFDVLFSTTQGEGMWLPGLEAAACGVPIVAPDWAAIGEIFKDQQLVPCTSTAATPNGINAIGGIMDEEVAIAKLDALYRSPTRRAELGAVGLALAKEDRFRWERAGADFLETVDWVMGGKRGRLPQSTIELKIEIDGRKLATALLPTVGVNA